ncbi:hypothetical protein QQM79_03385 [Marinobacteraceae bacterium S3BR75-40.1]
MQPQAWLNLRYVAEEYQLNSFKLNNMVGSGQGADDLDGSHVGLNIVLTF